MNNNSNGDYSYGIDESPLYALMVSQLVMVATMFLGKLFKWLRSAYHVDCGCVKIRREQEQTDDESSIAERGPISVGNTRYKTTE